MRRSKSAAKHSDITNRRIPPPGRAELLDKIKGHVIAKGLLIGTYERK